MIRFMLPLKSILIFSLCNKPDTLNPDKISYIHINLRCLMKRLMLLLPVIILVSCKNPVTPGNDIAPGRRDYTWTVDTLDKISIYNDYYFLWGTSPTNLWCIGEGGDVDKMILHYDGLTWNNFAYPGQGMEPWSIFGFSADDFWAGGGVGDIYRYTNGQFNKFGDYKLDGYSMIFFMKFWGNSPNDIYVVGTAEKNANGRLYQIMMHYDGKTWDYIIKPETEGELIDIKRGKNDSPNYYLINASGDLDSTGIYEFDGKSLKRIYNQSELDYNIPGIFSVNNDIYFGFNDKLLKYDYINGNFNIIKDFNGSNIRTMSHLTGRSQNDIFINMNDGIGHYNGSNVETIFKLDNKVLFNDAVLFEKDAFFICPDPAHRKFVIVHGQLK